MDNRLEKTAQERLEAVGKTIRRVGDNYVMLGRAVEAFEDYAARSEKMRGLGKMPERFEKAIREAEEKELAALWRLFDELEKTPVRYRE
jgi:hypothetical protein